MTPAISQVCTLQNTFAEDLLGYAEGGCTHIEVWLTKLEQHLESSNIADTKALLESHGITPVAAALQGGLLLSQGEARRSAFDLLKQRLELCQQFGISVLVVVADFHEPIDETTLGRSLVSLSETARWAAGFGVNIALEFQGTNSFCNNLDTALMIIEQVNEPNLGVCLDAFHYFQGPSKPQDLKRLTTTNLFHVQLCDVPGVPRELMTDADRVFPGEGDFDLTPIVEGLKVIEYRGAVSLELMNPLYWKSKTSQVAELGLTALQRLI
ncbi:hypothetical protein BH11PLA2_BH11PLA2_19800 [soil metagenome]